MMMLKAIKIGNIIFGIITDELYIIPIFEKR